MKAESNNKSKLSLFYPSSLTTWLTIVYFGVSIGIALQIGAANWDIIWHGVTDVESFFTPPHTVLYSGVALTIGSIFIGIIQYVRLRETEGEGEKERVQQPLADKPSELTTTKESLSNTLGDEKQSSRSSSSLLTSLHCLIHTLFKMP